jgi:Putative lumazine-binding
VHTSRIAALSLLALPALALSACGSSGSSDKDKVTSIITSVAKDPSKYCGDVAKASLAKLGGKTRCDAAIKAGGPGDPNVKIHSIDVSGDKATAKVTDKDGDQTLQFVKEDGGWKVLAQ